MSVTAATFHSIVLGRRKFGKQGFSRSYEWNNGDLKVCGAILHNYLENNEDTPWADVRYLFGEVMYGGHITDPWDRRITSTYLEVLICPDLVDEKNDFCLAPGLRPLLEGEYDDYKNYIEEARCRPCRTGGGWDNDDDDDDDDESRPPPRSSTVYVAACVRFVRRQFVALGERLVDRQLSVVVGCR